MYIKKTEKDPFPVDALPTCNHALSVCQHEKVCNKVYEDFKAHCKVRDNKCRMEDRDVCHESWTNLRMSPMFGCICPNNHMKRRCDRIFSIVNHNPCIDAILLPVSFPGSYETPSNSVHSESGELAQWPAFPHFLFPSRKIPLALASHRPATDDYIRSPSSSNNNNNKNIYIYNVTHSNEISDGRTVLDEHDHSIYSESNHNHKYSSRNDFVLHHQHQTIASPRHDKSSDKLHHRRISHQQEEIDMLEIGEKFIVYNIGRRTRVGSAPGPGAGRHAPESCGQYLVCTILCKRSNAGCLDVEHIAQLGCVVCMSRVVLCMPLTHST
ncbi:unnamed protein product [Hermetia illucens]|uniref:GDNF/GAS1 domain-containing protein n=1 Tax=Hermetia illucens TaxID=343691 RepID=A0A7R8YT24_HERIL|nr:unnamed protein product [Hermetia illucens]